MAARRSLLALPALLLARCGGAPPPPPPPQLVLTIKAGGDQNPDGAGHAAPVAVRLYFLGDTGRFDRADVFALTDREKATLGEDVFGSEEVIVRPGETRQIEREPKKGVQFLGVAVLFRDIDRATWRASQPVKASGPSKLLLSTSGVTVTLVPA